MDGYDKLQDDLLDFPTPTDEEVRAEEDRRDELLFGSGGGGHTEDVP